MLPYTEDAATAGYFQRFPQSISQDNTQGPTMIEKIALIKKRESASPTNVCNSDRYQNLVLNRHRSISDQSTDKRRRSGSDFSTLYRSCVIYYHAAAPLAELLHLQTY